MFNQNVAITVSDQTTNYGLLSIVGSDSERGNADAPIGAPDTFRISHSVSGKGNAAVDRHLVRIDTAYTTTLGGVDVVNTASAYVVLVVPHTGDGKATVTGALQKVISFMEATESGATATNLERVLNGEP